jgi:muramoyltetrapeptide carboxypeptidase
VSPARDWIKPRRLRRGDRITLVAPASPFKREELDAGVAELAALGYEAVYDDRVFARERFLAGDALLRAASLMDAWRDPTVRAVVAIRGGYGSAQMLPLLDSGVMRDAAKIFVGYSDTTALLTYHLNHGLACVHGPMVERRLAAGERGYHRDSFLRAVTVAEPAGELAPDGLETMRMGEASGTVVGGTLTQLVASLGTPWSPDFPEGCVLFLEDVSERPFRIHRMLTQLAQAGVLGRAAGLVFGEMPSCDEPGGDPAIRDVISDFVRDFHGPVVFGFPSGHTVGATWTIPFGVRGRLVTGPRPALVIEEAVVD